MTTILNASIKRDDAKGLKRGVGNISDYFQTFLKEKYGNVLSEQKVHFLFQQGVPKSTKLKLLEVMNNREYISALEGVIELYEQHVARYDYVSLESDLISKKSIRGGWWPTSFSPRIYPANTDITNIYELNDQQAEYIRIQPRVFDMFKSKLYEDKYVHAKINSKDYFFRYKSEEINSSKRNNELFEDFNAITNKYLLDYDVNSQHIEFIAGKINFLNNLYAKSVKNAT